MDGILKRPIPHVSFSLRAKTLTLIGLLLVSLTVLLYAFSHAVLLRSFQNIERDNTQRNIQRVLNALDNELSNVDTIGRDWATWDDTYSFAEDLNNYYRSTFLTRDALERVRLDMVLFINTQDEIIYGELYRPDLDQIIAIEPGTVTSYLSGGLLTLYLGTSNIADFTGGIVLAPPGPMLISVNPILRSDGSGPSHGTLVVGRYLDTSTIAFVSNTMALTFDLHTLSDANLPADFQKAATSLNGGEGGPLYRVIDHSTAAGYALVNDVTGNPVLILRVTLPREIYDQGRETVNFFLLAFLVSGLMMALVMTWLLNRQVLGRVSRVSAAVSRIGETSDVGARVPVTGNDELAGLAGDINRMLASLQLAQNTLAESRVQIQQIVSSISDVIYTAQLSPNGSVMTHYMQSSQIADLTGYPFSRFSANDKLWSTLIEPADLPAVRDYFQRLTTEQNGEIEYRVRRADGEVLWVRDSAHMGPPPHVPGLVIYGVLSNITARKLAEMAALESEERYSQLFDRVPVNLYRTRPDGTLVEANPAISELLGFPDREALKATNAMDQYVVSGDRLRWQAQIEREGVVRDFETQLRRADGSVIWVQDTARVVRGSDGKVLYYEGSLKDITAQKRAEAALRESEERFRRIADNIQHGLTIIEEGRVVYLNDRASEILGYSKADLQRIGSLQLAVPEERERLRQELELAARYGDQSYEVEFWIERPDGSRRCIHNRYTTLRQEGQAPTRFVVTTDVTGRKLSEAALRASEERYRLLFERSLAPVYRTTLKGVVVDCNDAFVKLLGYDKREDILQVHAATFYFDNSDRAAFLEALHTHGTLTNRETRLRRKDGQPVWLLEEVVLVDEPDVEPYVQGTAIDITTRKQDEAERERLLHQTQMRAAALAAVAEVSQQVTTILNIDDLLQTVTNLIQEKFDLYNVHIYLLDPEDRRLSLVAGGGEIGRQLVENEVSFSIDFSGSIVARAARTRQVMLVNDVRGATDFLPNPLLPKTRSELALPMIVGDQLLGVLNAEADEVDRFTDEDVVIQTSLAAQVAIALQNARLFSENARRLAIIENSNDLVALADIHDGAYRTVYINPAGVHMLGYGSADDINGRSPTAFYPAATAHFLRKDVMALVAERGLWRGECEIQMRDGSIIPVEQAIFSIPDEYGQPRELATIATEITERKRAEAELRTSEERLELALKGADLGLWDWDVPSGTVVLNERWAAMLGYELDELESTIEMWEALIHPADRDEVMAVLDAHLRGDVPAYEAEYRVQARSGAWQWVLDRGKVVTRDSDGRPLRALGTHLDITARKRNEEALRKAIRAYRMLSDCNQVMVRAGDEPGLLADVCEIVVGTGQYHMAWVGYGNPDGSLRAVAHAGHEEGYLDLIQDRRSSLSQGPSCVAYERSATQIVGDIVTDPSVASWRNDAIQRGYRAMIALPLVADGHTLGVLTVFSAGTQSFDPEEVALLEELAGDLTYGVMALRTRVERRQAEERLRQGEANLSALIENTQDFIWSVDTDYTVITINTNFQRRYQEAFGFELIPGTRILDTLPEPQQIAWKGYYDRALRGEQHVITEHYDLPGFAISDIEVSFSPIVSEQGDITGATVFSRDITARVQQEEQLRQLNARLEARNRDLLVLHEIGRALTSTLDINAIYRVLVEQVGQRLLSVNNILVALYDESDATIRCGYAVSGGEPVEPARFPPLPLGDGPVSDTIRTRQPRVAPLPPNARYMMVEDDQPDPRSALYVPLISSNQVIGVLIAQDEDEDAFDEVDLTLIATLANQAATAMQNAWLLAAERDQRTLAEALADTAAALNQSLDPDVVMDRILDNIKRVVPHDTASVMLIEDDVAYVVRHVGFQERGLEEAIETVRYPVESLIEYKSMRDEGRTVCIPDTQAAPEWVVYPRTEWIRSYIGAPIRSGGRLIGVVNLDSETPGFFNEAHAQRLKAFADQASIAIQNARLFSGEREQRLFAETLRDIAATITEKLDIESVLDAILEHIRRVVPHEAANIMLIEDGEARVVRGSGYAQRDLEEWIHQLHFSIEDNRLLSRVVDEGHPLIVTDTDRDPDWIPLPETEWLHSYACAPIQRDNQVIGFLNVYSTQTGFFTPAHAERLQAFAYQAASAIRNAQLFMAQQQHAAQLQDQARRLALINRVSVRLAQTLNRQEIYEIALTEMQQALGGQFAGLVLFESEDVGRLVCDTHPDAPPAGTVLLDLKNNRSTELVRETRGIVVSHDVQTDPLFTAVRDVLSARGTRSLILAPLIVGTEVIGTMGIDFREIHDFSAAEREVAQTIASQASVAITKSHLYESEREQRLLAEALRDSSAAISRSLDPDVVLDRILDNTKRVIPHDAGNIMLIEGDVIRVARSTGYAERGTQFTVRGLRIPITAVAYWRNMLATGEPQVLADITDEPDWVSEVDDQPIAPDWLRSTVKAPIRVEGKIIGIVNLDSATPGAFTMAHAETLQAFADQAGIAIHNAQLFASERGQRTLAEALHNTAAAINRTLDFDAVVEHILSNVERVVPCDAAALMFAEEDGSARVVGQHGFERYELSDWIMTLSIPINSTPDMRLAVKTTLPVITSDTANAPDWVTLPETGWIRSHVTVPLMFETKVLGFLMLDSATPLAFGAAQADPLRAYAAQAVIAIQNAQLLASEREQRALSDALRDSAAAINSALDFDSVLDHILDSITRVVPHDAANIMMITDGVARVVRGHGYKAHGVDQWVRDLRFVVDEIPVWQPMIATGRPFAIPDTRLDSAWLNLPEERWILSTVKAPIRVEGRVIGILHLDSAAPGTFNQTHAERLQAFADQAAIALRNAELFTAERDQRTLSEALRDSAAAVNSTLDFNIVLDRIMANVGRVAPYETATLMLVDEGTAHVARSYPLAFDTASNHFLQNLSLEIEQTPNLRWMAESGDSLAIEDTQAYEGWLEIPETVWIRSFAGAPIRLDDRIIGFITLNSATRGFFSGAHAERLRAFADQASVAIRNAQLFADVQRYASELEQRVEERTLELEQRRAQLQAILDYIGEGVIYDEKLETKFINQALTDLTGYTPDEYTGYLDLLRSSLYSETDFHALTRTIYDEIEYKGLWHGELRLRRKDGTEFEAALIASQVRNVEGAIVGAVTVIRDISQEKELQAQKDRFIASASHELRTPLANIKTRLYLLKHQPDRFGQHLQILDRVANNMSDLVENLLDVSRFERGVIELRPRAIVLQDLVDDVVSVQKAEADRKGIELSARLDPTPLRVSVDPQRMMQVITNLINNAINYTPAGGEVVVELLPDPDPDRQRAVMHVRDSGIGISAEMMAQVFEPFFRANEEVSTGTGLGLTIAREIVRMHDGDIHVESAVGVGSTFTVTLDLAGD